MTTFWQRCSKHHIMWISLGFLVLVSVFFLSLVLLLQQTSGTANAASLRVLSLSIYDTRDCADNPDPFVCDGQMPVITQGPIEDGSGACLDGSQKKFPSFFPDKQHMTEEIDLYWSDLCQSYFAYAFTSRNDVNLTIKIIEHSGITAGGDENHNEQFNSEQSLGPVLQETIWSPIKYSPTGYISAQLIIQDGIRIPSTLSKPRNSRVEFKRQTSKPFIEGGLISIRSEMSLLCLPLYQEK